MRYFKDAKVAKKPSLTFFHYVTPQTGTLEKSSHPIEIRKLTKYLVKTYSHNLCTCQTYLWNKHLEIISKTSVGV